MQVLLETIKDNPIHNLRTFGLTVEGTRVAKFHKSGTGWHIAVIDDYREEFSNLNCITYRAPSYHAAVRLAMCYIVGEEDRIPYLRRGIWTNPCPMPDVAQ